MPEAGSESKSDNNFFFKIHTNFILVYPYYSSRIMQSNNSGIPLFISPHIHLFIHTYLLRAYYVPVIIL